MSQTTVIKRTVTTSSSAHLLHARASLLCNDFLDVFPQQLRQSYYEMNVHFRNSKPRHELIDATHQAWRSTLACASRGRKLKPVFPVVGSANGNEGKYSSHSGRVHIRIALHNLGSLPRLLNYVNNI